MLVTQDRLAIKMPGEEKEIVDVGCSALASAIRQQGGRVLQFPDAKLANRKHAAILDEISPVGSLRKEIKQQLRRLLALPVLRLDQEDGLTTLKQCARTMQDVEFMSFHVDFDESHVVMNDRV